MENEQEKIMQLTRIERESEELEANLQFIDSQILELETINITLLELTSSKTNEIISFLGGRIFVKANIEEKDKLFVDVGSGVIVRKSPVETINIIASQLLKLKDAKAQIEFQLNSYQNHIRRLYEEAQQNNIN